MTLVETTKPRRSSKVLTVVDDDFSATQKIIFHTPISRFGFADFSSYGKWLADRLRQHWPQVNERTLYGWLKGCADNSEFHFVKTARAVGLSQIVHKHLNAIPEIEEVFVYVDDVKSPQALCEGAALYAEFKRWGVMLGADEITVSDRTDIPQSLIGVAIGKLATRETLVARVTV